RRVNLRGRRGVRARGGAVGGGARKPGSAGGSSAAVGGWGGEKPRLVKSGGSGRGARVHASRRRRPPTGPPAPAPAGEMLGGGVEPPSAGGVPAQRVTGARGEAGLFHELAPAAVGRVFAGIDEARRQLPGERFERRAVLPHDRDFPAGGERDDRDVIGLLDR